MLKEPICFQRKCINFGGIRWLDKDEASERAVCKAFPDGIPNEIVYGKELHLKPFTGDNGIQFEKKEKFWTKHGDHDQSTHGRGGGGGGGGSERSRAAKRTHKPSTAEKQRRGEAEQLKVSKAIGGDDTGNNKPFDVRKGKHAIEVKTIIDNNNDKITVHPESRRRKEAVAKKEGLTMHTIGIDVRGGRRSYYYKEGVGAYRLSSMEKVSLAQLKGKFASEGKSVGSGDRNGRGLKHGDHDQSTHGRGGGGKGIDVIPEVRKLIKEHELKPTKEEKLAMSDPGKAQPHGCYNESGAFANRYSGEGAELVHGSYDPGETGLRFGHAWVELPGDRVFDGATQRMFEKEPYLETMGAKEDSRYSSSEVLDNIIKHSTWGPWGGKEHQGDTVARRLQESMRSRR